MGHLSVVGEGALAAAVRRSPRRLFSSTVIAMAEPVTMPRDIYQSLRIGFTTGQATHNLDFARNAEPRPDVFHPGDSFGRVFAWVWRFDRAEAAQLLADYLADMRDHGPGASDIDPPVTLDEILDGLRYALPHGFTEYDEIVAFARRKVPGLYGDPDV